MVQNHAWKISDIGTFASNIGVILYQCPGEGRGIFIQNPLHLIGFTFRNRYSPESDAGSQ